MTEPELSHADRETAIKLKFAEVLLKYPNDPFKGAMIVTYGNASAALQLLEKWQHTAEIAKLKENLVLEFGEEAFLPSETEMVRGIMNRADRAIDDSDYCKLMALALDVRGMTSKAKSGPSVVVNNNLTNNKIMQIPVMVNSQGINCNDDEWEQSLIKQQEKLVVSNV